MATELSRSPPRIPGPAAQRGWPWIGEPEPPPRPVGDAWPRISVVVPSFNQGRFLEEALRSILLQGYPHLELLVLDGGSTDASVEILERYDGQIDFWVSEGDEGQSDAINKGFRRASGDLLTFFGSDDVYLPGAFFDAARRWSENPGCGAVVGAFRFLDGSSRPISEPIPPRLPGPTPTDLALAHPSSWRLHQVATFYDRRALDRVGRSVRRELVYVMDRELLYRVCREFPIVTSGETYALFRRHEDSKSVSVILPFCREMASLHLLEPPVGEAKEARRRRRRFARHWQARGFLKLAQARGPSLKASAALLSALRNDPGLWFRRGYWHRWWTTMSKALSSSADAVSGAPSS